MMSGRARLQATELTTIAGRLIPLAQKIHEVFHLDNFFGWESANLFKERLFLHHCLFI
jgi:hypothetical protein